MLLPRIRRKRYILTEGTLLCKIVDMQVWREFLHRALMLPVGFGTLCAAHSAAAVGHLVQGTQWLHLLFSDPAESNQKETVRREEAVCAAPARETAGLRISAATFPDPVFREAVRLYSRDGKTLTREELASVTMLDVSYKGIADLTGLAHFTALEQLYCQGNHLAVLDVSKNACLRELDCSDNALVSLTLGETSLLRYLYCFGNLLTSLDVSGCRELRYLYCERNRLSSLDVRQNPDLTELSCFSNRMTSLDVSGCAALTELFCFDNALENLRLDRCLRLQKLDCSSNRLTGLDVSALLHPPVLLCGENEHTIAPDENGRFDLSRLPQPPVFSRTAGWKGGSVSGSVLTVAPGADVISYSCRVGADEDSWYPFSLRVQ